MCPINYNAFILSLGGAETKALPTEGNKWQTDSTIEISYSTIWRTFEEILHANSILREIISIVLGPIFDQHFFECHKKPSMAERELVYSESYNK